MTEKGLAYGRSVYPRGLGEDRIELLDLYRLCFQETVKGTE